MGIFEHGYGLVIGVGAYSDPAWNVPIAERDATDLYAALTSASAGGYPPAQVELLRGAEASAPAVLRAIERLAGRASEQDTVFIAITSHGAKAENDLYTLATSDAQFVGGERIRTGSGLSIVQLASALKTIRAERLLLVVNACFAGSLGSLATKGGLREPPVGSVIPNGDADTLLASGKGRALITASRAGQRSYFLPDDPHSIFGQAIIDGLSGVGISPRSGYVGLFELYDRIYQQVGRIAALRGTPQEPAISLVDGIGPFPVALYSGADSPDEGKILRERPEGARIVQIIIDNSKGVDFGVGNQFGDVKMRDVITGNQIKGNQIKGGEGAQPDDDEDRESPLDELRKIRRRIATLNNILDDLRDDAVAGIDNTIRAAERGDRDRARRLAGEAAEIIDQTGHPTAASIARKLRAVRDTL